MNFIFGQMYPSFDLMGPDYLYVNYVAYGNAKMWSQNLHWNFSCQHGPNECVGNLIHSCANYLYKDAHNLYLKFLDCYAYEYLSDPDISTFSVTKASQYCCKVSRMDFNAIYNCAIGEMGNLLEGQAGQMTNSLIPPHTFTPWVVINGYQNATIQNQARLIYLAFSVPCILKDNNPLFVQLE